MKLLLVTSCDPWTRSVSTVHHYVAAGRALGHDVALFGPPNPDLPALPYTTDLGGYVHALNADDMTPIWSVKVASRGIRPAPIVADDYVVVASRDGSVYWLDRGTGEQVHRRELEGHPEILSDMLLITREDVPEINEPLIVVGTADTARLAVAFPLNPTSGYQGWIYSR